MKAVRVALFVVVLLAVLAAAGCHRSTPSYVGTYRFVRTRELVDWERRERARDPHAVGLTDTQWQRYVESSIYETVTMNADGTFATHAPDGNAHGTYTVEGNSILLGPDPFCDTLGFDADDQTLKGEEPMGPGTPPTLFRKVHPHH